MRWRVLNSSPISCIDLVSVSSSSCISSPSSTMYALMPSAMRRASRMRFISAALCRDPAFTSICSFSFKIDCTQSMPASPPQPFHACQPRPWSVHVLPCLSTSWRAKYDAMRCTVSSDINSLFANCLARARPTNVMPRALAGLDSRTSRAICALRATSAGGLYVSAMCNPLLV